MGGGKAAGHADATSYPPTILVDIHKMYIVDITLSGGYNSIHGLIYSCVNGVVQ